MYGRTFDGKWHYTKNNLAKCCIYLKIIENSVFTKNPFQMCEKCLKKSNKKQIIQENKVDPMDIEEMDIENDIPPINICENQNITQKNTLVSMGFIQAPNPIPSFNSWNI
jgi:hypothetical protein